MESILKLPVNLNSKTAFVAIILALVQAADRPRTGQLRLAEELELKRLHQRIATILTKGKGRGSS
jgi:hypothetical protein